jgi:hypothetical protein
MDKLSGLWGNAGELSDLAGITRVVVMTLTLTVIVVLHEIRSGDQIYG